MRAHFCLRCKNFIEYEDITDADTWRCAALPEGILYEKINDDNCQKCNNNIGFEQVEANE